MRKLMKKSVRRPSLEERETAFLNIVADRIGHAHTYARGMKRQEEAANLSSYDFDFLIMLLDHLYADMNNYTSGGVEYAIENQSKFD